MPRLGRSGCGAVVAILALASLAGCGGASGSTAPDEEVKGIGAQVQPAASVGATAVRKLAQLVVARDPVVSVVKSDPTLKQDWSIFAEEPSAPIAKLGGDSVPQFNLACNNAKLTATQTTVEFGGT